MSVRQGVSTELSITESAEALLKTLNLQPDYLLRMLTPLQWSHLMNLLSTNSALSKAEKIFLSFVILMSNFFSMKEYSSGHLTKSIREKFAQFIRMPIFSLSWNHFNIDFRNHSTF